MSVIDGGLNWVYAAKGLECLKFGLENYVDTQIEQQHKDLLKTVANILGYSRIDCSMQTIIALPIRSNFIPQSYRCDIHGTSDEKECIKEKCPNAVCNKLCVELKKMHRQNKPIWSNTHPSKWTSDYWEIAKCFLSSDGYKDKHSVKDVDCSGLLSILINMSPIAQHINVDVLLEVKLALYC